MPNADITKKQWAKFHYALVAELSVPINVVNVVRSFALHDKYSRKDIALWAADKFNSSKEHRDPPKAHYQSVLDFTASCTDDQWSSLLRDYGG
jgi:hypothetical protein